MEHKSPESQFVHGPEIRGPARPLALPIYTSSTYRLESAHHGAVLCEREEVPKGSSPWLYSRWGNPTTDAVAQHIADIEGGAGCILTSSGMAAISTTLLTFLNPGDHIVCGSAIYGGTSELIRGFLQKWGIQATWVDSKDIANYRRAIQPNTKILYGESPSNPTLDMVDFDALATLGEELNVITIIDGTFGSPYNQTPLKHGLDIVIHSATKFLGGHSDLLAGAIVIRKKEHFEPVWNTLKLFGGALSPWDAFLLERGIKTLALRVARQNDNANKLAHYLNNHPKIEKVNYPGLASHPQHELAKRQMKGFGGMISFEVKGGIQAGIKLIEGVKLITLAVSLGGCESLIEHAASMTHLHVPKVSSTIKFCRQLKTLCIANPYLLNIGRTN
jgi:methionine-gamma-lyase